MKYFKVCGHGSNSGNTTVTGRKDFCGLVIQELYDQDGSVLILLASCQQTCMTYTIVVCTVKKLLMMDRGTVRNM